MNSRRIRRFSIEERKTRFQTAETNLGEVAEKINAEQVKVSQDPVKFFEQVVGFKAYKYQEDLAKDFIENQFVAMRWNRQSGKSWVCSALLLNYAYTHPGSWIGIVAPGWRQSKAIIRRIQSFLRKMPGLCPKPARTVLYLSNGSIIESFPNNDATIRGPTLDVIYWDEANHTPNDEDLWTAILFTISTTKGKVLVSSTPWNTDSVFYKMFHDESFCDFKRSHVSWQQSFEPNGPLDKGTVDKIRKQFGEDPWRWKREMEAEWAEDEAAWLSQALITKSIATEKTLGQELELWDFEGAQRSGNLYAGLDLGKVRDHAALVVVDEAQRNLLLRHLKIFELGTSYASVIGYLKTLQDRWGGFCKVRVDYTNQDYVVEDMKNSGINNVEGVRFSLPRKQEMATLLKQRMANNQFWYPYFTWAKPYPSEWVTELNVERFQLRKDGSIAFNHPSGTHDDVFWACALAIYSTVQMVPELDLETIRLG